MSKSPWQQRIRRAERLAAEYPFAAEILGFYVHIARFQEGVYQRIERANEGGAGGTFLRAHEGRAEVLVASFPEFLALVEDRGPESLAHLACELRRAPSEVWHDLLNSAWSATGDATANPEDFLATAFLQPYAECSRACSNLQVEGYSGSICPFCNRKPAMGVLRQQGDGGRRSLLCGFCLTEWEFRRIVCPGCGQEEYSKLPVYTAETLPHIRVECCDGCKRYIKSIDLTKNGLAEPLVDELASVPLDLWAQERGYAKLCLNLLGM